MDFLEIANARQSCRSYDENRPVERQKLEKILETALPEIYTRHTDIFLEVPKYAGVEALADSAVVLRFTVKVTEENFFVGRRTLSRDLKLLLDKHNIEIPFTQIVLHQAEK